MTLDLAFAVKVFAAHFAIMNPIANIPIFLSLTDGSSDSDRRRIARVTLIGCVVSAAAVWRFLAGWPASTGCPPLSF